MDQFLMELQERNETLADWARARDYSLDLVYAIARGRIQGRRGMGRDILIAMGVKPAAMFARRGTGAGAA